MSHAGLRQRDTNRGALGPADLCVQGLGLVLDVAPEPEHQGIERLDRDETRVDADSARPFKQFLDLRAGFRALDNGPEQPMGERVRIGKNCAEQIHDALVAAAVAGDNEA